jgi:hypothetical protein
MPPKAATDQRRSQRKGSKKDGKKVERKREAEDHNDHLSEAAFRERRPRDVVLFGDPRLQNLSFTRRYEVIAVPTPDERTFRAEDGQIMASFDVIDFMETRTFVIRVPRAYTIHLFRYQAEALFWEAEGGEGRKQLVNYLRRLVDEFVKEVIGDGSGHSEGPWRSRTLAPALLRQFYGMLESDCNRDEEVIRWYSRVHLQQEEPVSYEDFYDHHKDVLDPKYRGGGFSLRNYFRQKLIRSVSVACPSTGEPLAPLVLEVCTLPFRESWCIRGEPLRGCQELLCYHPKEK